MPRLLRAMLVVALLAAMVPATSGAAEVQQIAADQTVELDFPATATFRLTVDTSVPVDVAELRYATSGKEFSNAGRVRMSPTDSVDVEYVVDAVIDYIEPGVDITYSWVLLADGQPVARTAESTVTWIDDSFDWRRYESEDVLLYTYGADEAFARYMLDVAQTSANDYKIAYDIIDIEPMRIWVYANGRDFSGTLRQNSEAWIGGFSMPEAGIIAVPIESGDDYSVQRVITHEVSHHVLHQATKNPFTYPPTWLDEGLAVIGQLAGNEQDLDIVIGLFEAGTLPTLRTLSSSFPTDPVAANRSYATSHIAVEFLIERWGPEAIVEIIRGFRQSLTSDQSLMRAIGLDTEGLDAEFRSWLRAQAG